MYSKVLTGRYVMIAGGTFHDLVWTMEKEEGVGLWHAYRTPVLRIPNAYIVPKKHLR